MDEPTKQPLVSTTRLRSLRSAFGTGDRPIIIAIHDYPDPDAIAAALAIQTLTGAWGINAVIAHGGIIGRAENYEMVALLKIDLKPFSEIPNIDMHRGAIFLDTQPMARNQSLPSNIPVLAVIDHHTLSDESVRVAAASGTSRVVYSDIRPNVGSSSTLALGYLDAAGITPDARLATALFLGIKTDTDGLLRGASADDIDAYTRLLPLADLNKAAKSVHPPLDKEFFRFLSLAFKKAEIFGTALIANCGEVKTPDLLSAASDFLVPLRDARYALAVGFHNGRAYLSLRAKPPYNDATRVLLQAVGPNGKGGGHSLSAGGFVNVNGDPEKQLNDIRTRYLEATGNIGRPMEELIL